MLNLFWRTAKNRVSTRLTNIFYQGIITDPELKKIIPPEPEKSLFSTLISEKLPFEERQTLEKEISLQVNPKGSDRGLRPYKKLENFELQRSDYRNVFKEFPHGKRYLNLLILPGKVNVFEYKNTKFTLIGTEYEQLPSKNLYKLLSYSKPSIILLQLRPDQILKSIDYTPRNEKTEKFSNRMYFSQLTHRGQDIMPSGELRDSVYQELIKGGLFVDKISENVEKKFKPYDHFERLHLRAIATSCLYAENHNIDVVLGDVPELIYRQNIANSLTLMQLQNIFTHCSREIALYPDMEPQTPFTIACYLYPDIFLRPSDKYISTLFEYLIHRKYDNIFAVVGNGQSQSIMDYLDQRKVSTLEKELEIIPPMKHIIKGVQGEEIIEKHALLDVLFHGKDILEKFEELKFKTSYEMIKQYCDPQRVDSSKLEQFRLLHYQFITKYQAYSEKEYANGKKNLKREFLTKVGI